MTKQLEKEIRNTIRFLQRHKWCTGDYHKVITKNGRKSNHYCVIGAYNLSNGYDVRDSKRDSSTDHFQEEFQRQFGMWADDYNDNVATKKERVIGKLRAMLRNKD
jgi:hypothetical protein